MKGGKKGGAQMSEATEESPSEDELANTNQSHFAVILGKLPL